MRRAGGNTGYPLVMDDPLRATIEEFAADGYTHVECFCPRCRRIRLRPMSWLPGISMGLTLDELARRLRCAESWSASVGEAVAGRLTPWQASRQARVRSPS